MSENQLEIGLACTIKGFSQINLENSAFKVKELDGEKGFLKGANRLMDLSIVKEGKFLFGYVLGQDWLDTI